MLPTINGVTSKTANQTEKTGLLKSDLLSRDAFLKLFIEQLKNQDPLNPMKNYELSAQLAQFSQLEQLYDINKNFDRFSASINKSSYFQGINLIGKKVQYEGSEILKSGNSPVNIKFDLNDDAAQVNINIYDENDNFVRAITLQDLTKGENSATWDGKDATGNNVKDGIYKYEIIAYNREGDKVDYRSFGTGLISTLRFDPDTNEALFKVNNEEITIDKIYSIANQEPQNIFNPNNGNGNPDTNGNSDSGEAGGAG